MVIWEIMSLNYSWSSNDSQLMNITDVNMVTPSSMLLHVIAVILSHGPLGRVSRQKVEILNWSGISLFSMEAKRTRLQVSDQANIFQ